MSGDTRPAQERRAIDTTVAHSARVHDYWLGGKDNFAADREAGDAVIEAYPGIVMSVRANRAFLARAVRFLAAEAGIRQFLDIGTGIPAANNTHEVAQSAAPNCRVVYVDYDPVVLTHARALLTSSAPGAIDYIDADLRDPQTILQHAARTLDFSRPVAVMLIAIMHLIVDDRIGRITRGVGHGQGGSVTDDGDWRTTFRPDIPSAARIYDYLINEAGIRQIVDIGAGLPTVGNTHEIARDANPEVRVVYVDHDPVVLAVTAATRHEKTFPGRPAGRPGNAWNWRIYAPEMSLSERMITCHTPSMPLPFVLSGAAPM
jgi:hypothetical protein